MRYVPFKVHTQAKHVGKCTSNWPAYMRYVPFKVHAQAKHVGKCTSTWPVYMRYVPFQVHTQTGYACRKVYKYLASLNEVRSFPGTYTDWLSMQESVQVPGQFT